jgi:hypothetical protein
MDGAAPIIVPDLQPCFHERTAKSPFDPHYFYLGIWAAKRIMQFAPEKHVDVGSKVDFVGFLSCFTKVIYIDIRPLDTEATNLESRSGSILNMPFESASVGSLSCLHVAEHIGLGRYGDELDPRGTEKAAVELSRVLAVGGDLLFALPIGKPRTCFNAHRIHSLDQVMEYFHGLDLMEFSGVDDRGAYHEKMPTNAFDDANYACGFFWFRKPKRE